MRYKEMSSKEIVDIQYGQRLGMLGQTDLEINKKTGQINSIIIPNYKWFGFKKEDQEVKIRWSDIKTIGEDMILVQNNEEE